MTAFWRRVLVAEPTRRTELWLFALLFVSYAYFSQAGGWNENSRLDLVRAIVDDHTFAIDRYQGNTGDKATLGGHFYSDKVPGLSLAAIPAYALVRTLRWLVHDPHTFVVLTTYLVTVLTIGVTGATLGVLFLRASRKLGASLRGGTIAAIALGLGTPAFPFSTMMFGHQLAALLLFLAFWQCWRQEERFSRAGSVGVGLLCAAAIVTELPAAGAALVLLAYHALSGPSRGKRAAFFLCGAVLPGALLLLYLTAAFGSPFKLGYGLLADPEARAEMLGRGVFGLTYPRPSVILELLVLKYRGLLPFSPVLILALGGFVLAPREHRRALYPAGALVLYFVLFVSSYAWWQGGSTFGPRHLIPMLPFLALPLGIVADRHPRLVGATMVVSILAMTMVTAVDTRPTERIHDPFFKYVLPAFLRGDLALGTVCPMIGNTGGLEHRPFLSGLRGDAFNLGMVLGLRGLVSLLPLLASWVGIGHCLLKWTAVRDQPARAEDDPAEDR
jgi:hypothetical protein